MTELHIETRDLTIQSETLRSEGKIPAVFYGAKETNTPIIVDIRDFRRVWEEVGGSAIIDLVGLDETKEVLVQEVAWHPVTGDPIHVDFYCIERGKKVTVTVPLVFINEAPAEKLGGIVVKALYEIEIEVRPRDIPQNIEVDLSSLEELTSVINVGQLQIGETVTVLTDSEDSVASITLPQEEEEDDRTIDDVEIEGGTSADTETDEDTSKE